MRAPRLTFVVGGMLAAVPNQGGWAWLVLQYLLGLRRLGHEVHFVESLDPAALQPTGSTFQASANARYFREIVRRHGLEGAATLVLAGTRETIGLGWSDLWAVLRRADVLLNLSGVLREETLTGRIPVRVYIDLDPAFTQLWNAVQGIDMNFAGHTHFATIGPAIGQPGCGVPTCGLPWIAALQPVVLSEWPVANGIEHDALTTIANWRGYGSIEYKGKLYGQKAHSLRRLMDLPKRTDERFLLALAIHPDEERDLACLRENGWRLADPVAAAGTPEEYRRFIQGSRGELGIAKSGYVHADCGWFSDRSICYLASGRPVIAQETGFSRFLPTGEGLLAFSTTDQAVEAIEAVRGDYRRHARAARAIAEEIFDSDRVLPALLAAVGAA